MELPFDVWNQVAGYLNINDLNHFSSTCHFLNSIGADDSIWRNIYAWEFGLFEKRYEHIETWKDKYNARRIDRVTDVKKFNINPTVLPGLDQFQGAPQYLIERFAMNFLRDPSVGRVARGIYLSFIDKRTQGLLDAYFDGFDFEDQTVLDSLSLLLGSIQFPAHFSVITKFMLCFAQRYFACNENSVFKSIDAVYVLAFGIIMLNTDMHNSAVKNKMTLHQYINNSSNINDGENLPEIMLLDIYNKVKERPLVFNNNKLTGNYESSLWSWVSDWISKLRT